MSTYTLISSSTLSATAASVTFSAIPATYTDLVLKASARDTGGGTVTWIQGTWNTSASGYSETFLRGNGSAAASGRAGTQAAWGASGYISIDAAGNTANTFGSTEIYIPNYTVAAAKPQSVFSVQESNSASTGVYISTMAMLWNNTATISSMLIQAAGIFDIGSSFYLYGISNS